VETPEPLDPLREALRSALRAHVPADGNEEADLAAILRLVETEAGCFARSTYAPGHVTGSGFIVHPPSRRVLLHHHRRLGAWLQMGGHDEGESDPRRTALREGAEESGLTDLVLLSPAILDVDVHPIPAGKGEPPHLHHDVRYALATRAPETIRRDDAESIDLRWFSLEEAAAAMDDPDATRALARIAALLDAGA
jgi:8-oxo-dGTP pyrophosphatase MutT (NUDIX family)